MSQTARQSALVKAYQSTHYEVQMKVGTVTIRVGQALPAPLQACLDDNGIHAAALLSACNPFSRPMTRAENAERHAQLVHELCALRVPWLPGRGRDPLAVWDAETSVLALGLAPQQAMQLAQRFEQNAYVEVLSRMPARLVFTTHWRGVGA